MVPFPAKQNRISWLGVCECSRTYPPGAMTCIPIARLSGPACLGLSLTIEQPFAQIGCQYDCPLFRLQHDARTSRLLGGDFCAHDDLPRRISEANSDRG